MAEVYRALDPAFEREVAIKVLRGEYARDPVVRARFLQEARTVARLEHPAIVPIYDAGQSGNYIYLVMRLMTGGSLQDRIEHGALPTDEIIGILERVGAALDAAHAQGVIHRDVKPENILFDQYGKAYLGDFGIIKVLETEERLTADTILGTPAYMSPEQVTGRELDGRSDLYSLGVVVFEMITGQLPYTADTAAQMALQHVQGAVPRLRKYNPGLPRAWEAIVARTLAKDPRQRYTSAQDLAAAFVSASMQRSLAAPLSGRPVTTRQRAGWRSRLLPFGLIVIMLFFLTWGLRDIANNRAVLTASAKGTPSLLRPTATVIMTSNSIHLASRDISTAPTMTEIGRTGSPATPTLSAVSTRPVPTNLETLAAQSTLTTPAQAQTAQPSVPATIPAAVVTVTPVPDMLLVPAGDFVMGSTVIEVDTAFQLCQEIRGTTACERHNYEDELPAHVIRLGEFWIDRTEVTNDQFATFVAALGYVTTAEQEGWGWVLVQDKWKKVNEAGWRQPQGPGSSLEGLGDHPVVQVSWFDANVYCVWREARLPTEAEWEKAARGTNGLLYPWGNEFEADTSNFCDQGCPYIWPDTTANDHYALTAPVGSYPTGASPYGALDMAGNAWEWLADWHDAGYYTQTSETGEATPVINPMGPASGVARVIRGGSWSNDPVDLRTMHRGSFDPTYRIDTLGFRCVHD